MELWLLDQEQETTEPSEQQDLIASSSESALRGRRADEIIGRSGHDNLQGNAGADMLRARDRSVSPNASALRSLDLQPHACRKCGDVGTSPRRFHPSARALSYWRTGCRVLGEITRRLEKPLVKPNSGQESAEMAPRRSPVRVRLAPSRKGPARMSLHSAMPVD
jgi:hypothetical protein